MATWQSATQTIRSALTTGQIGTPVAARIVAHLSADHGRIEAAAASGLAEAAAWLDGAVDRISARGSVENGQISVLARLDRGQSVVVSAGSSGLGPPLLEIVVWGSRGIVSWEGDVVGRAPVDDEKARLSDEARRLLDRIREALGAASPGSRPEKNVHAETQRRKGRKPPYGVLLVAGDHTHQPNYAEALVADKRCRLVGLADEADVSTRRKQLNEQLARRLGIPVLADLKEALGRDDVHVVSICAEPIRRGRIAVLAAEAGKHLYLDKPLAGSLRDADAIVAAVQKTGVVDHMFSLVHSDAAARVREVVESGELGALSAVHFDLCFAKGRAGTAKLGQPREETRAPDRFELADSKRELSNVGVYPLVMLLSLVKRRVLRVSAVTSNYFFAEHQKNDMEDFGQMLVELEGGLVATFSVGRTGWRSHAGGGLNRTYLTGTKKCAVIDTYRPRVEVWADVEPWLPPKLDPDDPMGMWAAPPESPYQSKPKQHWIAPPTSARTTDAAYFLDCIQQGRESVVTAEVAAAATEVLMAGYQSAATGKTAKLPLQR